MIQIAVYFAVASLAPGWLTQGKGGQRSGAKLQALQPRAAL